ncbi:MAG: AmmeMemoRadiSam system radical SAM enzyme [Planctomycetota bacterium]|jgi:pyruvate formate lyase activating enzyme
METRRDFIKKTVAGCGACGLFLNLHDAGAGSILPEGIEAETWEGVEARYYEKMEDLKVRCVLCPRECIVADRERGYCGVRENRGGDYITLVHSRPCSAHVDPIEKKPLFHFHPGHKSFSIATVGCNIECKFCQNWEISQFTLEQRPSFHLPPEKVVERAFETGCRSIAYTYTEPVIFYEYMYDTALAGKARGVKSVMISNGYIQEKALRELIPVMDAVKIDLKAFTESFYKDMCSGELKPVLETLKILKETGIWFEIVVLIVPTKNDSEQELKDMCSWVKDNLSNSVPIHFNRFHPVYKVKDIPRTPESTLKRAYEIARETGLKFPYVGNLAGNDWAHTYCPHCNEVLIKRIGFYLAKLEVNKGNCNSCGKAVPGVW